MPSRTNAEIGAEVTDCLIRFVLDLRDDLLPGEVRHECTRSVVNAVGCIMGGASHELTRTAAKALLEFSGAPVASLFGTAQKADILTAALLNGTAGAAYSFDDTYSEAMLHPSGPIVVALISLAQHVPLSGQHFMTAFAAGLEVACRLTKALTVAPAKGEMGWSQTGVVCGLSASLAAGKALGLDRAHLVSALGIAASEASGTRASHGSMAASLIFGHAAQVGLRAALLAGKGFTASARPLEHRYGFAAMFAQQANLDAAVAGLGEVYELMHNTYKPFPCGLVLHPAIDGVLRLRAREKFSGDQIAKIQLGVSAAAVNFGWTPEPKDDLTAKVSLHHWVAVAAQTGRAGIAEGRIEVVHSPAIRALRNAIEVVEDPLLANDAARVRIVLKNGEAYEVVIKHCTGSPQSPMSDEQIEAKCIEQAELVVDSQQAAALARMCWDLWSIPDAAALARQASLDNIAGTHVEAAEQ